MQMLTACPHPRPHSHTENIFTVHYKVITTHNAELFHLDEKARQPRNRLLSLTHSELRILVSGMAAPKQEFRILHLQIQKQLQKFWLEKLLNCRVYTAIGELTIPH